ncbi:MAG: AbrB/MazE/SpoVT family DNA-binding domain-containing protein [Planctomyces sp.]|jgi:bifunctional DNA-binding transcriptional regulator/antitoxin component of YhaV-PrlF toxin-antitoxin module
MEQLRNLHSVSHARVDGAGRIVIPIGLRQKHGIASGQELIIEDDTGSIRLRTMDEAVRDVQARCRKLAEPGILQSDEMIRERRAEAARELAQEAGPSA